MPRPTDAPPASIADFPADQRVALKLWITLSRAYNAVHAHAVADVRQEGLSIGEFAVLELLYHRGPSLLGEIQRRILVSSGGITFLVDKLAAKGLVERRDAPDDRRARLAALTRDGTRLMKRIFPRHAARVTAAMAGLTLAEQREATRLLKRLGLAAADAASGDDA